METTVINIHSKKPYDIYIGRKWNTLYHFGNPFTHTSSKIPNVLKVGTREESIDCFSAWLKGEGYFDLEVVRRQWVLSNLYTLRGKVLGCFCDPLPCHGWILANYAEVKELENGTDTTKCQDY